MLSDQVDDAPAPVALLEMPERERGHFGPTETAAEKDRQNGAIAQPADCRDVGRAQKGLRLAL